MTMNISAALLLLATTTVLSDAVTTVAVVEIGKGGVVRRTTTKNTSTTVPAVKSFWSALHTGHRQLQQSGMPVVPDIFNSADNGLIVGLTNVDMEAMPMLKQLVEDKSVAAMNVNGQVGDALCDKMGPAKATGASTLIEDSEALVNDKSLSPQAVKLAVQEGNADVVDKKMGELVASLEKMLNVGETLVLHIVVEEEEGASHRRLTSRRLEDVEEEGEEEEGEEGEQNGGNQGNGGNKYYGYGYYDRYGNWVTPYKTMFQIQYFNIVLWTSVALVLVLFYSTYLMIDMPLEADTLLFGESAKMMGE